MPMPARSGLFPVAAQHGLQIIYELCGAHFRGTPIRFSSRKTPSINNLWVFCRRFEGAFCGIGAVSPAKEALFLRPRITPAVSRNEAILTLPAPQASTILASLGQAAFVWDIATDAIAWSDHVASVFPDIPPAALASGAEFSKLIEPVRSIRSDALGHAPAGRDGAPYRIEYGVRTSTSAPVLWIEESGCCSVG